MEILVIKKMMGLIKTGTYYQVFAPEDITKDKTIYDAAKKLEQDFRGLYENGIIFVK